MTAAVYQGKGNIVLEKRPVPRLLHPQDAIIKVTLTTICSSDIHIKHGAVPKAVPGTILGHEFVGIVEKIGAGVNGWLSMWRLFAGNAISAKGAM